MEKPRKPTLGEVNEARERKLGDFGNEVLYALCTKNPAHTIRGVVAAKVNIIGRVYAASIERGRGSVGDRDHFREKVVRMILHENIDKWFRRVRKRPSKIRPNDDDIALDLKTHMKLMTLFGKISTKERRSLASKYLHFHFRNRFYIFDSRAAKGIRKFIKPASARDRRLRGDFDKAYARFYVRCENLNKLIYNQFGRRLTPRQIDNLLLARR